MLDLNSTCFEQLEVLDLHGNAVSGFGKQGLHALEHLRVLNLAGNKFSSMDWSTIPISTLTELDVSKNRFSGILFPAGDMAFDELRTLNASYNDLDGVAADGCVFPVIR